MQTAGSGPDSPSTAIFATLPVIANGHLGNLGSVQLTREKPSPRKRDRSVSCRKSGQPLAMLGKGAKGDSRS